MHPHDAGFAHVTIELDPLGHEHGGEVDPTQTIFYFVRGHTHLVFIPYSFMNETQTSLSREKNEKNKGGQKWSK